MRLQLLHELVTMTLGVDQSTSSTTILPNPPTPPKMPGIGVVFGRYSANSLQQDCAIGAACPICGFDTQKK